MFAARARAVLLGALLVSACGAPPPSAATPTASAAAAASVPPPSPSETAAPGPSGDAAVPGLAAVALPADIEPASISAGRLLYRTEAGPAGILDVSTGARTAFPDLPGGRRFAPVRLAGTVAAGEAWTMAADGTIAATSAMAFNVATGRYVDVGATLGQSLPSSVLGSDEATIVGMVSSGPKPTDPARAYVYDVVTGRVTIMPGLPDGYAEPQPLAVSGRYVVGNDGTGSPAGGFVYDMVTGRYTMLWGLLGSHSVEALGVDGSVVVGGVRPISAGDMSPFVYDLRSAGPSVIPMSGFEGRDVDGARVLLVTSANTGTQHGWVYRTDTMTGIPLDAVRGASAPTGTSAVVPVNISGRWVLGYVPNTPPTGPFRMVLVQMPPGS